MRWESSSAEDLDACKIPPQRLLVYSHRGKRSDERCDRFVPARQASPEVIEEPEGKLGVYFISRTKAEGSSPVN
jgi:hypothetical protein